VLFEKAGERFELITFGQPVACLAENGVGLLARIEILSQLVGLVVREGCVGFGIREPIAMPKVRLPPELGLCRSLVTLDLDDAVHVIVDLHPKAPKFGPVVQPVCRGWWKPSTTAWQSATT
jgi:hypothetical protein